ncbi:hypothetical protein Pla123a_07600 [Posidoniimonas polymericola]|uniref:PEP-CTERM protein-sorting domain-containing protein n=1 Tax=Posidoniimonas polymericola TaxID=2528002 RepID=A0A5C5ZHC2_9BACT|nr:hypothetical protein [Posidoniimonas polymericola]TWT85953.1 hypothetical protein Pla123a_07600 [Posidoniimonas polymericola]
MRRTLALATLFLSALSAPAHAVLIGYDGFDYPAGSLAGRGSASDPGFSTAWTQSGSNGGTVSGAGLTYANLQTSGGAVDMSAGGTTLNFRGLDAAYNNPSSTATGEFWFSYLVRPGAYTGTPFVGLSFYTDPLAGDAAADPDFGLVARNQGGEIYGFTDLDVANHVESNVTPTDGETALLVGRVVFGGGSNTSANNEDQIQIFVNPVLGGVEPPSDADGNVTADFQSFRIASQNGAPFVLDELRFGDSFADVTPVTPPNPDLDGSGVGISDFEIIRDNFLTEQAHGQGDVDFSGFVDHQDYFLWRTAYLTAGGSEALINWSPAPEPGAALLLLAGIFVAPAARRPRQR